MTGWDAAFELGGSVRTISTQTNRRRLGALLALVVGLGTANLVLASSASAATTFTVTTTADIAANAGACGNASITTAPSPLSLREATCLANNLGGAVTINLPAGHYTLLNGELQPGKASGQNVTISGAGSASTIIDGGGDGTATSATGSRVFDIDMNSVGGVNATISGVTITNGHDTTYGGAGILDGSLSATPLDQLTISNSVITKNAAVGASQPGGGVAMAGGNLSITNTTISGNSAQTEGAGVWYSGQELTSNLTVSNSTFSGNSVNGTSNAGWVGGAGISVDGTYSTYSVTHSTFVNNHVTDASGAQPAGGGIEQQSGTLTVTGSNFSGNTLSGPSGAGAAVFAFGPSDALHYNRFVGNTGGSGAVSNINTDAGASTDAADNWWGCNTGPGTTGCDSIAGNGTTQTVSAPSWLKLSATASPSHVVGPNGTATITASLTTDSLGASVGGSNLGAFDTLPVSFSDPPGDATVAASSVALSSGQASVGYNSHTTLGPDNDIVTLDNASVSAVIEVDQAPAITSANNAHFDLGTAGSFTVTTTGYPSAALTESGTLPAGLTFVDQGNGTAKISGTPTGGGGSFPITVTANNGYAPNATQTLTISVGQPPAFTSAGTATFQVGQAGSFTVTTSGVPTVSTITESGSLPAGVTFTDNGNGTATIAGTPTGSGNTYPVTLSATNGVSPNATQSLTIQVNQAPSVTSNPSDQTVQPGTSVTFTAAADGVPTPTVQWQRSTDGGASFSNVAGATSTSYTFTTALADDGNQYRAVFTNGVGTATTTAATLRVGTSPAFTSADHTSFVVGQAGSFTITTSGVPAATLSRTGTEFPAWVTLTDNGDGTGTLTGTPPAGSAGPYTFTLKAANGFTPSASQTFTLEVDDSPVITSADHTRFAVGSAGTFAVTTTAGFPTTTTLTKTGALPTGVTFHDNGDGTATLAGTPAVGTGGVYDLTITADNGGAAAPATQTFTLTVTEAPAITSADHTRFAVGSAGSFTVTTTPGTPSATTLNETGALPAGVTFHDNGDGTATLAGTPGAGTGGVYDLTITAGNGSSSSSTQSFTLTVTDVPSITSADHATFTAGSAGTFAVTTTPGYPTATTLTETGTLPSGVSFADNGDGTASLTGTPTAGAGGSYSLTLTATNSAGHTDHSFTLTVDDSPAITSADHATFRVGQAGSFTVTTTPGTPSTTTLTSTGTLPDGVTFTDNGDGTATYAGTPKAGTVGDHVLQLTADNGASTPAGQTFTLTVAKGPQVITVTSGQPGSLVVGDTYTPVATSDSGLPVVASVDASSGSVCHRDGTVVRLDHTGTCVVDFDQSGDASYLPADTVQVSLGVGVAASSTTVATSPASAVFGQPVRATATVTGGGAGTAGEVQFALDGQTVGAPVPVTAGQASSGDLIAGSASAQGPGAHQVTATFVPAAPSDQSGSTGAATVTVAQAATHLALSLPTHALRAVVSAVAPGSGMATGPVGFSVDGRPVGSAQLVSGVATLPFHLGHGTRHRVTATYAGDADFAASSASTSRRDPTIRAHVSSPTPRTRYGWYAGPVTVRFSCRTHGAPLTEPCPAAVTLRRNGAGRTVARTITATDGGVATVAVRGISIDHTRPRVRVAGLRNGGVYPGTPPHARCVAHDALSGIASCRITRTVARGVTTVTARATDRAGNQATATVRYRTLAIYLENASLVGGVFQVRAGHGYTIVVHAAHRPRYYDAAVAPQRPTRPGPWFHRAGRGRWVLGVDISRGMRAHRFWNLGVRTAAGLKVIRIHVR